MSENTPSANPPIEQWYVSRKRSASAQPATSGTTAGETSRGMRIAIQGEPGSFSHEAAMKLVPGAQIVPCAISSEAFSALSNGQVDAACVPIENSLAGSVSEHFDLLLTHDVKVEKETLLRIRHNLIGLSGAQIGHIDRVFSHPVALAQCKKFLASHPRMESYAFYDTAGSIKQLVEIRDRHAAGIASRAAAEYYGAEILAADIQDNAENYTRFFLVRRAEDFRPDPATNKLSLAFSVKNKPGALVSALSEIARIGANLTKIESRPVHGKPWEYIFYADCQLSTSTEAGQILAALMPHCDLIRELGRYKEAEAQ